jgi:UDP-glucose 4-epimerase
LSTKRILIVGGAGFVGRRLAAHLAAAGHRLDILVRRTTLEPIEGAVVHAGGLENVELLRHLLPQVDAVFHVASATTPGVSRAAPSLEASLNIAPTLRLLEMMQDAPGTRLVYMSSGGTVYGDPASPQVGEAAPLRPLSYYGAGKVAIETFIGACAHAFGIPATVLRPSNLYGPGQPRYLGFGVVRSMLQHVIDGSTMEIWGDGRIVRDFLYIDDLVAAFDAVLTHPDPSGTFNVGSGDGCSLNELVEIVQRASGRPLPVRHLPARTIDVQSIVLDCSAIRARLGWRPRVDLADGIARTWSWLSTR